MKILILIDVLKIKKMHIKTDFGLAGYHKDQKKQNKITKINPNGPIPSPNSFPTQK